MTQIPNVEMQRPGGSGATQRTRGPSGTLVPLVALIPLVVSIPLAGCALRPAPTPTPVPVQAPPAPLPPPASVPAPEPPSGDLGELQSLLIYHQELRALGPAELAREWTGLGAQPRSLALAIRKAMLLGQGRGPAEWAQAQAQLDAALAGAPPGDPLRPLATLMVTRLADQRRLGEANDRLGQQLRDSQRRNEQLAEKLEALKAIEQRLPVAPGAPRPAAPEVPR